MFKAVEYDRHQVLHDLWFSSTDNDQAESFFCAWMDLWSYPYTRLAKLCGIFWWAEKAGRKKRDTWKKEAFLAKVCVKRRYAIVCVPITLISSVQRERRCTALSLTWTTEDIYPCIIVCMYMFRTWYVHVYIYIHLSLLFRITWTQLIHLQGQSSCQIRWPMIDIYVTPHVIVVSTSQTKETTIWEYL